MPQAFLRIFAVVVAKVLLSRVRSKTFSPLKIFEVSKSLAHRRVIGLQNFKSLICHFILDGEYNREKLEPFEKRGEKLFESLVLQVFNRITYFELKRTCVYQ